MHKYKVVLLGDGAVGKTSLVRRFVTDQFSDDYIATIGCKVTKKNMVVQNTAVSFIIWDILGQKGYSSVIESSMAGAKGALLVVDLTRKDTLESISQFWIPELRKVVGEIPMVLIGNKSDLNDQWEITPVAVGHFADMYGLPYLITSAKSGDHVPMAFDRLGLAILFSEIPKAIPLEPVPKTEPDIKMMNATDAIIKDFCQKWGPEDMGLMIVRKKIQQAELDIYNLDIRGLTRLIDLLEQVETESRGVQEAGENKKHRMQIMYGVVR